MKNRIWLWLLLPALAFIGLGCSAMLANDTDNVSLNIMSTLSFLFGGIFLGLITNLVSDSFGKDRNEWLPLAESSCKQILKMQLSIGRYLEKESGEQSFCASISSENKNDKALVKKHCDGVEMKLQDLNGDLSCIFSDWQNFINENCRDNQCEYIWDRVYSILPSQTETH